MSDALKSDDEYVAISLENKETISGKTLMISAYGAIFFLLFFYFLSIFFREKKVLSATRKLKKQLKNNKLPMK